jgi:hypothetical protein
MVSFDASTRTTRMVARHRVGVLQIAPPAEGGRLDTGTSAGTYVRIADLPIVGRTHYRYVRAHASAMRFAYAN